ncbi:hypothetical protein EDB92DRAFT_1849384 [Lactarius akahatsu]|uniref:Uncharacterized protein n=1 Tax=Lactarius akahatsu TaxID=416441 RepID=A0AAD4QF82_9AGAM|nr:hypothetical protein EDB92DRAFT_1849384 [Lactarius akahatsu]
MKETWDILSHSATIHTTPTTSNASSTRSSTRTSLRPPIFNPYDRFTQPEFDAWIGDITSSIKRALRHEVEPEVELPSGRSSSWKTLQDQVGGSLTTEERARSPTFTEPRDEESIFEDSFAHIASRRAKGKARDPREGPGLGLKDQPIELLSDSEEEEVVDNLEEEAVLSETSDDGAWEGSFEETGHTGSGLVKSGKAEPRRPGASVLSREDSGHVQEVADYSDADAPDTGEEDDPRLPEESFCEDDLDVDCRTEGFSMQRGDSEDDSLHLSQSAAPINVELVDPWDGPRTFAEDYYSGGDRLAPGLTPDHLTPVVRSPVPISAANFPPKSSTDANADCRPAASSQRSIVPATFVDSEQDELETESYYDHLDVTVHGEDTECKGVESAEVANFMEARPVKKKILMSGTPGSDQRRKMVLVPFSDDEHTDADGEDDEERFSAIPPLGTSDLDIGDDWGTTGRHEDVNDTSDGDEEDEIQELVPTQTTDGIAKTAALTLTQFSEVVNTDGLSGRKVAIADPSTPTLAQTFQLPDAESFGDLPMSSPPSESPSPAADGSMEQLFAVLKREIFEGRSETPKPSTLLARESEAESTDIWAYQELEKILSEGLSATENATGVAGLAHMEDMASQEIFSAQRSEYVVEENGLETGVLSVDDSDDACSIPLDMLEVVETIQRYEVEEPETDVRLTEVPEIAIQDPDNEDTSITAHQTQPVDSPVLEYPALSVSAPRTEDTSQAGLSSAAEIIPAPIVADPSVPDPVPGDSSPTSPVPIYSPIAPRLSIVPSLTASDLEPSQISTEVSGLFTPAQRSGVGTPVVLEDETAEVLRTPDNESNNGSLAGSTPPADKLSTAGEEDEDHTMDKDLVRPNNPIKVPVPSSPNAHQLDLAVVDVDGKDPKPDTVEIDDDISSTPRGGSVEPAVSPPSLTGNTSGASLKHSDPPDVLASGGDPHPGTDIAEGDEDADGEADPDYPPEGAVAEVVTVGTRVASNEVSNDTLQPSPIRTEEPQAIRGSSSSHTSPTLQDNSSAQDNGIFDGSAGSDVKAANEGEEPTRALKRKRRYPNPGSTRITRSQSGAKAGGGKKKGPSSRRRGASRKSKLEQVNPSVDSADEDASEIGSVSSGASAVYRLLHPPSRAGSVISSASGDAPWASPLSSRVVPLVHSHGLLLHHHGRPAPPPLALPVPPTGPLKDQRSDQTKTKSPAPTSEPSTPTLRRSQSINSPVTRSNCRFHKISLPRGDSGQRAHFVVPGCALGDGELMEGEDIKDEGLSTHEDHKRMLPNVETLDLDPYLVGVLRQLVGVDLLREQQEIFYLPSEKEKLRKRRQTDAVEILRQLRRQSASSGGPLAREHSPRLLEDWQVRATPPRSASGSVRSGSARAHSRSHSEERDSALSDLSSDDEPEPKRHRRLAMKEMESLSLENASTDGTSGDVPPTLEHGAPAEKEQTRGGRTAITRSKRKALHPDAVAYKPSEG